MDNANPPTSSAVAPWQRNSLASMLETLKPAGPQAIKPLLAKLSLACRTGQADDIDRRAQAALYVEQLSDLPLKFLALAIDEWIKTQVFFPAVSELREITARKAKPTREEIAYMQKQRAEREAVKTDRPTAAQMDAIKAEIAARWASKEAG